MSLVSQKEFPLILMNPREKQTLQMFIWSGQVFAPQIQTSSGI